MATLQAARAKVLGLPVASAQSWGLNRAIFYAAAKRGFKARPTEAKKRPASVSEFWLGDDKAYKVRTRGQTLFTIGGEAQTPKDFERQIMQRFSGTFREAWSEALDLVQRYDRKTLESQTAFYQQVYRPRRDELAKRWNERALERSTPA